MTNETNNTVEAEVVETKKPEPEKNEPGFFDKNSETFSRIFFTILFGLIGWIAVWIFCFVVVIQFGFLLITGKTNSNLKGFNKEIGLYLMDMIKYFSFQTDEKPFPFRDWPYDEKEKNSANAEQNANDTVEVSK